MSELPTLAAYMHIDGWETFEREVFNKRKVRAGFRRAGQIVAAEAEMAIRLARGSNGYPVNRSGRLVKSIRYKVSRPGFLVKIAPTRTSDMPEYYPAYLHYGVRKGARVRGKANGRRRRGERQAAIAARNSGDWRIKPRANYMVNALEDSAPRVRTVLQKAFGSALFS
ncbi:hypothetical protein N7333_12865 [Pseudomonas sp. GD04158]|uniref:hypothetical protein n=1 Tax=Pseudomonas sp. GD04158 TaxID=2975439 RepID=UPI002446E742|nr:hypothetical protein [Pseudomonas sp. GD04158]MDH0097465.1 hypothetical protein [Pseudomonas sp. GD04158]